MKTDLVLSPFNTNVKDMLDAARAADEAGFDGVWVPDHFSAHLAGKNWSHHPFTALGAIAAVTERVRIGCLVANINNRHPSQVASALGTLCSLAPHRVVCGLGAGAGSQSHFAAEHAMVARTLPPVASRREHLAESIAAIRAIWNSEALAGDHVELVSPTSMVPDVPIPEIIVGASTVETALVGVQHADGVNLRRSEELFAQVRAVADAANGRSFDIAMYDNLDPDHPVGGPIEPFMEAGITRRTLAVVSPYPIDKIRLIGAKLAQR